MLFVQQDSGHPEVLVHGCILLPYNKIYENQVIRYQNWNLSVPEVRFSESENCIYEKSVFLLPVVKSQWKIPPLQQNNNINIQSRHKIIRPISGFHCYLYEADTKETYWTKNNFDCVSHAS